MLMDNTIYKTNLQQDIAELKPKLPSPTSCIDLKKESSTSYARPCHHCGGRDRLVYKSDSGRCWCRHCCPESNAMDTIEFHMCFYGKSLNDLSEVKS
jgi:hypothetical protein